MTHPASAVPSVRVRAPGKVNIMLRVGALQDDGYHDLATAFQALSLYEYVTATAADDVTVEVSGSVSLDRVPLDDRNIAVKAARLLAARTGHEGGVHLTIEKHVPVTGGMGGGSADAAATLVACDALWGTNIGRDRLTAIARELGADVPFALVGGTAIGTGRGDVLSPALATGQFEWVLAISDQGLSTPEVYAELDRHRARHRHDIAPAPTAPSVPDQVLQALRAGDSHMLAEVLDNDLQAAALHLAPGLSDVLEIGEGNGALAGVVSGSGPTVAFLAATTDTAIGLQVALSASGLVAVRAHGPVPGARIEP